MKCIKCGETSPAMFYPHSIRKSDYRCKGCIVSYNQKYIETHREKHNAYFNKYWKIYGRNYYQHLKYDILSHYSEGKLECANCYSTNKLSIDHINGNGGKHRLSLGFNSSYQFYLWLKRNHYPEGYRVLCVSCNSHFNSRKGKTYFATSKLVMRAMYRGITRSKEIADWAQSPNLTRRAIFEALRRLVKKSKIIRGKRGEYQLP